MSNIEEYKSLIIHLYNFYNSIKDTKLNEITKYLSYDKKRIFNIEFKKQFYISSYYKNQFIHYDKKNNIFHLSLDIPKEQFNKLKNNDFYSNKDINVMSNNLTEFDLITLVKKQNISFEDYIKGEFIYELFISIIDLKVNECITYDNEFGKYKKKYGAYLTKAVVEYLTRDFTLKNNIFYLPKLKYQELIKITKNIVSDDNISTIYNGDLNDLLENESNYVKNKIKELEEKYFEEEFKLKPGVLLDEELENLNYKNIEIKKIELKEKLNKLKQQITE